MNLSSILLHVVPARMDDVRAELKKMPGVEVHAATGDGKLVLTLEDADARRASDAYAALHGVAGVFSVALVYQYEDDQ